MIRIMLVDDNEDFLLICKEFLEDFNSKFIVDTFTSAAKALKTLSEGHYDVVISDYQLAGMNGIEFLICSRSLGITSPFILITGQSRFDFLPPEALVREGATNFLLNLGIVYYLQRNGYPATQYAIIKVINRSLIQKTKKEVPKNMERHPELADIANQQIWISGA